MSIVQTPTDQAASPILPQNTAPLLNAHLAGVALSSPDPSAAGQYYEMVMGYEGEVTDGVWNGRLDGRSVSFSDGPGNTVRHAAFAVPTIEGLESLKGRLTAASVRYEDIPDNAMLTRAISLADPDGNIMHFGLPVELVGDTPAPFPARLQHIVFATDQTVEMVRFYCDVMGFAPLDYVKDKDGDLTSAFLNCGVDHHSLAIFRADRKRLDHLCYDVADWLHIRDWADRFADHRVVLNWGPGRHGPGNNLFLFIKDPDGNWLEFSAELEQVVGDRPLIEWVHEERTLNSWGSAFLRS